MEKTSYNWYKLSDDNVIGGNSNRCLKIRGELNNLSQSNLKDWMGKGRNCFQGGGDLDNVTTLPSHEFFITHLASDKKYTFYSILLKSVSKVL